MHERKLQSREATVLIKTGHVLTGNPKMRERPRSQFSVWKCRSFRLKMEKLPGKKAREEWLKLPGSPINRSSDLAKKRGRKKSYSVSDENDRMCAYQHENEPFRGKNIRIGDCKHWVTPKESNDG